MKITLALHQFLPDFRTGTELIAYYLAKALQARGHEVAIVTGYPAAINTQHLPPADAYDYDGLRVHRFQHTHQKADEQTSDFQAEYDHRLAQRFFREHLLTHRPDIVHFLHLSRLSASAIDACIDTHTPSVFTATDFWAVCPTVQLRLSDGSLCPGPALDSHNCVRHLIEKYRGTEPTGPARHLPNWLLRLGIRLLNRGYFSKKWYAPHVRAVTARADFVRTRLHHIDRILVPSRTMIDVLAANGFDPQRLTLIPYGIPIEQIPRSTARPAEGPLRVAFTGQLAEHKGPHVLINALRFLPRDVPLRLRLHGDPQQVPAYSARLRTLAGDDPRIDFAGPFDNQSIGTILREADVMACPSLWFENTPLVIYEAMAAGVPVVASDLPGMAEIIKPEINGLLFPRGDAPALAQILHRLAHDRPLVANLAAHTEPPLSVATHAARVEAIYKELLPPADNPAR